VAVADCLVAHDCSRRGEGQDQEGPGDGAAECCAGDSEDDDACVSTQEQQVERILLVQEDRADRVEREDEVRDRDCDGQDRCRRPSFVMSSRKYAAT
jgi:hypothetical protein